MREGQVMTQWLLLENVLEQMAERFMYIVVAS